MGASERTPSAGIRALRRSAIALIGALSVLSACSGSSGADPAPATSPASVPASTSASASAPGASVVSVADGETPGFVSDVFDAIDAVEAELGTGQEFFEVTSNEKFTNVFVAVDDATAAVAYAYVDGELEPPAPAQDGAEGDTFTRADVVFDPQRVAAGVSADLPETAVDAISVYGDGVGATYVLAASSPSGGFLDIVVTAEGAVVSVDPV